VGRWKLNPSKTNFIEYMKVGSLGGNKYALDLGDGAFQTISADGTDQPCLDGTETLSITAQGPYTWRVVRKKGATVVDWIGIWELSKNGKTLRLTLTVNQADGSTVRLDNVYKRTAAGSGFVGTWEGERENINSVVELNIGSYEDGGLSFILSDERDPQKLRFDGKDYPNEEGDVPGAVSSGRRANELTLEITDKIKGKIRGTRQMRLSPDLKTLTITENGVGAGLKSTMLVFDRE